MGVVQTYNRINISIIVYLLVIPFLNGLFDKELFYPAFIVLQFIFVILLFSREHFHMDRNYSFLFFLQFFVVSLSAFYSVNKGEAVFGLFKSLIPVFVFVVLFNISRNNFSNTHNRKMDLGKFQKFSDSLLVAVAASGAVLSFLNIYIASRKYRNTSEPVRLDFIIPYANTLAVFLFCCSIIGMYFLQNKDLKPWNRNLLVMGVFLNITAMLLTLSRTMWVLSVALYVIYLIAERNKALLLHWLVLIVISVLFVAFVSYTDWNYVLPALLFAMSAALCSIILFEDIESRYNRRLSDRRVITAVFAILLVSVLSASVFLIYNSQGIYLRILSLNINASELQERFAYYSDSTRIIKDYPILGLGAGGWSSIQYSYQSALYAVKYVHSSVFQVVLDYGIAGVIIFLSQILLFVYYLIVFYKSKTGNKNVIRLVNCLAVVNIAIMLHSLIDIDLEFPVMSIVFWMNAAILSMLTGTRISFKLKRLGRIVAALIVMILVVAQVPLFVSSVFYSNGISHYKAERLETANGCFESAIMFNPISSQTYYMIGEIHKKLYLINKEEALRIKGIQNYNLARRYDRFSPRYPAGISYISRAAGDYENSVKEYRNLILCQPLVIDYYQALAKTLFEKAEYEFNNGLKEQAFMKFREVIEIETQINKAAERISYFGKFKSRHKTTMELTPELIKYIGKAFFYLGDTEKSDSYLSTIKQQSSGL